MICRGCHEETGDEVLVDLGSQPLANSLVNTKNTSEPVYPLRPVICKNWHCRLIQLPELPSDITPFTEDYPYRSGQSESWKTHLLGLLEVLNPRAGQVVVDVGGNDGTLGTLLPPGVGYLNFDPSADPGQPENRVIALTEEEGEYYGGRADYVVALNVMAHVPDLDDFLAGIRTVMKDDGLLTVEVQDANQMIVKGEWDCIYHEHYSYFNAQTLSDALERRGFFVERVVDIPTHGGSLRAYVRKNLQVDHPLHRTPLRIMKPYPKWPFSDGLSDQAGMCIDWVTEGKRVVGYGAPAKAMTWLNAYDVRLECIMDSTPEKIGKFTPGSSHIPIVAPNLAWLASSDIVVILAWNWLSEVLPKIPEGPEVWARGERLR